MLCMVKEKFVLIELGKAAGGGIVSWMLLLLLMKLLLLIRQPCRYYEVHIESCIGCSLSCRIGGWWLSSRPL